METAEMLKAAALRYFDDLGRLTGRLAKFEARLDEENSRRQKKAA
jgi:hypothetical protein